MQVSSLNEVKIYSLSAGRSLPEVRQERPPPAAARSGILAQSLLPRGGRGGELHGKHPRAPPPGPGQACLRQGNRCLCSVSCPIPSRLGAPLLAGPTSAGEGALRLGTRLLKPL